MPNPREFVGASSGSRRGRRSYPKVETLNKGLNCEPIIFHREYTKRILPQSSRGKPRGKAGRPRKYKVEVSKNYQDSPPISETLDSFARSPSLSSDKTPCKRQRRLSKDDPNSIPRLTSQKSDRSNIKIKSDEALYKLSVSQSSERSSDDPSVKVKNFTCHECGMQFKTKGRFDKHVPCRVHRNSEYFQKPHLKRGRKSLNSKSLNNIKLPSCSVQRKNNDSVDETSLLVRIIGKPLKSDNFITYLNDEPNEANDGNFPPRKPSITGILKFHLSPNQTIEFLVCANKLAVKQCISALDTNSLIGDASTVFDGMNNCNTKEYLTESNTASSSLPLTSSSSYLSTDSILMPSSSLSSVNSGKVNQEAYTNLTTVYQKDYIFNTHDINMTSNSLEYHDRSQDELQAARTILSLARGSTDDMVLNMGQIMMELDNAPKVNNSCEKRDTPYNTDINDTITELKTQGDEIAEHHSRWISKQENETSDKSMSSVSSTEHSVGPISNLNAFSNTVVEDMISNDFNKCVSGDNTTTTTITTTNNNVPLSRPTDHLIAIQPTKLSTHCTTDVWNPISTSQNSSINNNSNNNTNNIVVQRKIRPPPKKRLSTNYTRSNSSRSFTDNTNSTTKLQDNINQTKTSSSINCEQLTVSQSTKQVINISSSCSSISTEQIDTQLPSFPSTSGIGLLPTPIQFTNVVYGNPNFISSQNTPLTSYVSNIDPISHQSNPMNGFTMVFPSPRPITPTPSTLNGSQPPPSFFILPQLMVLPRFIGSYIPMITAPEPYPSTINPIQSTNLAETRPSTFMTSSLVTPIPTAQPEFSTNHPPVKTIILQPPTSTTVFGADINTTVSQLSDDHQSKPVINNTYDDVKVTNGSDSNLILSHQSDTSVNSVKDKLLLPPTVISTPNSPSCSKKYDNAKCVWSSGGFNTTKPIPIRPVPEVSRIKPNNALSTVQNKSLQDQFHTGAGQNASDQKMLPILVSSHDLTNNSTKLNPTVTTCLVTSTSANNIIIPAINYNHSSSSSSVFTSSLSGNFISPSKSVGVEISVDSKQSHQQVQHNKLVTILPANQPDRTKCQYRPIHHKRRINFTKLNSRKKYLSNSLNSQRSNTSIRGRYRCQDNSLHTTKSYHHLKKHWHTHSNIRPFVCHNCDISFKTRGNLSKHMKSRCHHDRFLRGSGFTQVPLTSNSSVTPVVNRDFDHHSREVPRDSTINNNNSIFEDRQNYRKSPNISSASSLSSSCKTRNSSGATNNRSFPFGSKRNQVKSSLCTNFHGITSKSLSSTSATTTPTSISSSSLPGIMSSKASTLQSNIICSNVVDSSSRIPAPNVNAVNLSQDLPMNLSAKPQEPIALIKYIVEPSVYTKMNGIQSNHLNHSENMIYDKHVSNNCLSSAEVIVQTAVEAARNLATDKPTLKQTDKFSHSTPDSKNSERIPTPGNLSDHVKPIDAQVINFNTSDLEEQYYSKGLSTSTPCYQENGRNDKSCPLPSSSSSCTTCTEDSSTSEKLNKDMKQNNVKSLHTSNKPESDARQSHGVKSHAYLKDPRPYKCNMCHVGFRVSGHLCKHYRSKSHMSNILQMAQLSNSTIERILQSHMGNLQLINPDTGELSMRILEKIIPPCEFPTITTVNSGTNGHS
ncbi:unnamed protein product [Schistosoma margrebowiei]|nr:unnamed protein product [Schistosoma margrebowiei]